jgi:hypothetical protein
MTASEKLHALIAALRAGQTAWVNAKAIGASAPGFHAAVQSGLKHGGGHGFELVGEPHKDSGTGLYDKARLRRLPPNTKPAPLSSNPPGASQVRGRHDDGQPPWHVLSRPGCAPGHRTA